MGLGLIGHAEILHELSAGRVPGHVGRIDLPGRQQFSDHGMVLTELGETAVAQMIDPAVAEVARIDAAVEQQDHGQRGPHALAAGPAQPLKAQLPALLGDQLAQPAADRASLPCLHRLVFASHHRWEIIGHQAGRDVPAGVPSHAIDHAEKPDLRSTQVGVFVLLAHLADMRGRAPPKRVGRVVVRVRVRDHAVTFYSTRDCSHQGQYTQ